MKKLFVFIIICFALLCGCSSQRTRSNEVSIIEETYYLQVEDINNNFDYYLGKTIKVEGVFRAEKNKFKDRMYYSVSRGFVDSCCAPSADIRLGFEVIWEGDEKYPQNNEWVRAVGVLDYYYDDDDQEYLYLNLTSLNVLDIWGAVYIGR